MAKFIYVEFVKIFINLLAIVEGKNEIIGHYSDVEDEKNAEKPKNESYKEIQI